MVNKISEITRIERRRQGLTQEKFGEALCEKLPGIDLSKQAVSNWELAAQTPGYLFLVTVFRSYADWRYDWALACLQAIKPELWGETEPAAVVENE
jgi:transcriptional regulator with XRE-family HTH domain